MNLHAYLPQGSSVAQAALDPLSESEIKGVLGTANPAPVIVKMWLAYVQTGKDIQLGIRIQNYLTYLEKHWVSDQYTPFVGVEAEPADTESSSASPQPGTLGLPAIDGLPPVTDSPPLALKLHSLSESHTPKHPPLPPQHKDSSIPPINITAPFSVAISPALSGASKPEQQPHTLQPRLTSTPCVTALSRPLPPCALAGPDIEPPPHTSFEQTSSPPVSIAAPYPPLSTPPPIEANATASLPPPPWPVRVSITPAGIADPCSVVRAAGMLGPSANKAPTLALVRCIELRACHAKLFHVIRNAVWEKNQVHPNHGMKCSNCFNVLHGVGVLLVSCHCRHFVATIVSAPP